MGWSLSCRVLSVLYCVTLTLYMTPHSIVIVNGVYNIYLYILYSIRHVFCIELPFVESKASGSRADCSEGRALCTLSLSHSVTPASSCGVAASRTQGTIHAAALSRGPLGVDKKKGKVRYFENE